MQLYVSTARFLTWVSFLVLLTTVASKPLLFCQRQHQQVANPRRHVDFLRAMSSVNDHITKHKLYVESSFTDVSPPIYVFLQCRQDLSVSHCRRCFNDSKLKLEETCSSSNSGRVHGDNCFLRFDNRDFSEEFVDPRFDRTKCKRTGPVVDKFWIDLDEAFVNATLRAVKKGGFGAASVSPAGGSPGVYALAQCWQRLDGNSCRDCLVNARSSLRACESSEARAFFTGCYLKYSTRKFFDDAAVLKLDDDEGSFRNSSYLPDLSDQDVMKLAVAAFSLSILTSLGAFISYKRGYLAPEYLIKGQLTEKADVYAYGVLIIEIATGKKNNAFSQGTSSALHSVWEHFKADTLKSSVDPRLKGMFTEEEALKVLEIGLLCVQSSVELRPSMSEIVYMLKNNDCKFDSPRQPPFLSASVLMADEETRD
ncbi:hypothetical protein F2Q68_00013661 [Brassica cretica]|uniref:Gnk2-homologous domain-containing protein n=1 Tax=Brassica cretica TaxID=69181 RepID=A0A8S9HIP0_BRACR|nr:hypothetical protein F2Q68_00013661 [Brassica cretica]